LSHSLKQNSLARILALFDKTRSFLAAHYAAFRGLKKKFARIRGKRFVTYGRKKQNSKQSFLTNAYALATMNSSFIYSRAAAQICYEDFLCYSSTCKTNVYKKGATKSGVCFLARLRLPHFRFCPTARRVCVVDYAYAYAEVVNRFKLGLHQLAKNPAIWCKIAPVYMMRFQRGIQ